MLFVVWHHHHLKAGLADSKTNILAPLSSHLAEVFISPTREQILSKKKDRNSPGMIAKPQARLRNVASCQNYKNLP